MMMLLLMMIMMIRMMIIRMMIMILTQELSSKGVLDVPEVMSNTAKRQHE